MSRSNIHLVRARRRDPRGTAKAALRRRQRVVARANPAVVPHAQWAGSELGLREVGRRPPLLASPHRCGSPVHGTDARLHRIAGRTGRQGRCNAAKQRGAAVAAKAAELCRLAPPPHKIAAPSARLACRRGGNAGGAARSGAGAAGCGGLFGGGGVAARAPVTRYSGLTGAQNGLQWLIRATAYSAARRSG